MAKKIGLLKGDGIGPEISDSLVRVFSAMKLPIEWVHVPCGEESLAKVSSAMPDDSVEMIRELGVAIKGPTGTPTGTGHRSANVTLRARLDLYSNVRPCFKLKNIDTPFEDINLVIVRENTEDVYLAIEHQVSEDVAQCLKIITKPGSERICRSAFELARAQKRKKVTCIHKANIMKLTDGLFLNAFREVAKDYPEIEAADMIIDATCMNLVRRPSQFDVLVTENLYGDILSDLCAGLIGGLGLAGGANIGDKVSVFEAVHGTAPDIAGKNLANPTALLLSGLMMLEHLKFEAEAKALRRALDTVYEKKKSLTGDLGGKAGCTEFTAALISEL